MTPRLLHHRVAVDVRQQTEAEPGQFGLEDITSRSISMMAMMVMVKGGDVKIETAIEEK